MVPDGYEVYESIRGQVFLRKITKKLISQAEMDLVRGALNKHAEEWRYKTEIKKNMIIIHEAGNDGLDMGSRFPWVDGRILRETLIKHARYMAVMRFILVQPEKRLFQIERFCFLGSVDKWISIDYGPPTQLSALLKKYVRRLGKESIYDLY